MLSTFFQCKYNSNYTFEVYNSMKSIDIDVWNGLNVKENIYLSTEYLTAFEKGMNDTIHFRYLIFKNKENESVGGAVFQIVRFRPSQLLQDRIPCSISNKIKTFFLEETDVKLLICGSLFACGEVGFMHNNSISNKDFFSILSESIAEIQNTKLEDSKISFCLLKEFWPNSVSSETLRKNNSFLNFDIDVNMILQIEKSWKVFDDYLGAMNTKYRTRAKSVLKKSKPIKTKTFSVEDIMQNLEEIDSLYKQILSKAAYNLGVLEAKTFVELKRELKDSFNFTGYFIEDKLIGFASAFIFGKIVDANYIGINYRYVNEYKLYQRILYDYVELAIVSQKSELRLGRTAETSKSGIGAKPVGMTLFAKHRNNLPSKLLKPLVTSIKPDVFELRQPFKK